RRGRPSGRRRPDRPNPSRLGTVAGLAHCSRRHSHRPLVAGRVRLRDAVRL
ncbi:uncharacterized protein METZ01_LOCUS281915, partial [marine metagenome]